MDFNPLSQHENALRVRALRNQVLSSNIANADTPGYKARDIDFKSALENAAGRHVRLAGTDARHLDAAPRNAALGGAELKYRIPMQPSLDGNTVETDVEQAAFAENALMYRASLAFLDGRIRSIQYALKGGD